MQMADKSHKMCMVVAAAVDGTAKQTLKWIYGDIKSDEMKWKHENPILLIEDEIKAVIISA